MCTTGTNGFRGCNTSETPVAKNGFPAASAGVGGRIPSRASASASVRPGLSDEAADVSGLSEAAATVFPDPADPPPALAVELDAASTAAGYLSPHTAEKLQPPFSKTSPRSSLISPPPPPSRFHARRTNLPPSNSSSRAQIRSRNPLKYSSASLRNLLIACGTSSQTTCRRATPDGHLRSPPVPWLSRANPDSGRCRASSLSDTRHRECRRRGAASPRREGDVSTLPCCARRAKRAEPRPLRRRARRR